MSKETEALGRFYSAINRNDMEAVTRDFDPEIVRIEPRTPTRGLASKTRRRVERLEQDSRYPRVARLGGSRNRLRRDLHESTTQSTPTLSKTKAAGSGTMAGPLPMIEPSVMYRNVGGSLWNSTLGAGMSVMRGNAPRLLRMSAST